MNRLRCAFLYFLQHRSSDFENLLLRYLYNRLRAVQDHQARIAGPLHTICSSPHPVQAVYTYSTCAVHRHRALFYEEKNSGATTVTYHLRLQTKYHKLSNVYYYTTMPHDYLFTQVALFT